MNWSSTTATNGAHTVTARAVDNAGNTATSTGSPITVDNSALPTASMTTPAANATVAGNVAVTATAGASAPNTVTQVDFFFDNQRFATDNTSPYSATWNTLDTGFGGDGVDDVGDGGAFVVGEPVEVG